MLAVFDPDIVLAVFISFVLVLCLAIVLLRDPYKVPPQLVSRKVRRVGKHCSADEDFVGSMVNG